jgi:hypothetical protein
MAKPPAPPVGLGKIEREEKTVEVRLRFKGRAAADLLDFQRAYQARHSEAVDPGPLVQHIVQTHIDADEGFQSWRRENPDQKPSES